MLGLIGTFWGLLITIAEVGGAMKVIAKMTDTLGTAGDGGGMGGIITAISKPLEGMGLAFSSSLFGLAGSLVVGFFNYSCGQAQDSAIEDFSRWIDENILPEDEKKLIRQKNEIVQSHKAVEGQIIVSDGGQDVGREKIDGDTSDIISQVLFSLNSSREVNLDVTKNFEKLLHMQSKMVEQIAINNEKFSENTSIQKSIYEATVENINVGKDIATRQSVVQSTLETIANEYKRLISVITEMASVAEKTKDIMQDDMSRALKNDTVMSSKFNDQVEILHALNKSHEKLLVELQALKNQMPQETTSMLKAEFKEIGERVSGMAKSLDKNLYAMQDVAKEGNMQRMSRILKEMQIFWMKMRINMLNSGVVSTEEVEKD